MERLQITPGSSGSLPPALRGLAGMLECGSVEQFRAAGPLPNDAQEVLEDTIIQVAKKGLNLIPFLMEQGLSDQHPGWLGTPEIKHRRISRSGNANRGMVPGAKTQSSQQVYSFRTQPLFATWDRFDINIRDLETAKRLGGSPETSSVEQSVYECNVAFEDQAINGLDFTINGNSTFGLLTAPNASNFQYTGTNKAWDDPLKTGKEITDDIKGMVTLLNANNHGDGPFLLVVNKPYEIAIKADRWTDTTTTAVSTSVAKMITDMEYGNAPIKIIGANFMPADRVALIHLDSQVVKVRIGQEVTPISWAHPSGFSFETIILGCMVTQWFDDHDGQSGVCLGDIV